MNLSAPLVDYGTKFSKDRVEVRLHVPDGCKGVGVFVSACRHDGKSLTLMMTDAEFREFAAEIAEAAERVKKIQETGKVTIFLDR